MNPTLATEEIIALKEALKDATRRSELLKSELIVVRTERDLLKERLSKFMRKIFSAKSEVLRLSKSKGQPPPDIPVFLRALAVTEPVVVWDEAPAR